VKAPDIAEFREPATVRAPEFTHVPDFESFLEVL
jgi:hypothetical protein